MIPEGWRAALAALALAVTALIIYGLFASGFGRPPRPVAETPEPIAVPTTLTIPRAGSAVAVAAPDAAPAVITGGLWLTYLPGGLGRSGGGAIEHGGGWARFGSADTFVEARVDHGPEAADWRRYRARATVLDARSTTVRGKPAVAGRHPGGGRVIVWLERPGAGAWIRVSESLGKELVAVAASVRTPVGD
ncbi:hypothetical protein ACTMTI_49995 [Nonomuraea sp. H19]|uniref:hypothetical protein n=1 Tax=Nonomuraea sp. H19 TaxID=3452206 RepID=UPI003F8A6633